MDFGKRRPVKLDAELAARMDAIKAAQGITLAEQVRRAIKLWLETVDRIGADSRERPYKDPE